MKISYDSRDWRDSRREAARRQEELNAKMTVVVTIQAMSDKLGDPCDFDELWAMSLKELRELQDKLIKQYRKTINKGDE